MGWPTLKQRLINNGFSYPAVDTNWINMAVILSPWSQYLKKGAELDTDKVNNFFKKYDAFFSTDATYILGKLGLMQGLNQKNAYVNYEALLSKTPNSVIENTHHVYNKMYSMLSLSADSAYALSKYLIKTSGFKDWVHHTYAQDFLHTKEDGNRINERKANLKKKGYTEQQIDSICKDDFNKMWVCNALLEMMNQDPLMEKRVKGLYLWVAAKNSDNDVEQLIKTSKTLKKLDNSYFIEGNYGRYQLLVYQLLKKSGSTDEAQSLLNYTIEQLEKFTADTLNKDRFAHKNLLASAYYFKYLDTKTDNPSLSFTYFSKAAQFSPVNATEKVTGSFYDRVFLKTSESYRKEFVSKLFESGGNEDALKIFIAHQLPF